MKQFRALLVVVGLLGSGPTAAIACDDVPEAGYDPEASFASLLPSSLADPAGVRAALASRGIQMGAAYIGEVFGNTSGGLRQSTHYDGRFEFYVNADFNKLAGMKGLCFRANGYQIHGTSISTENLGSLMPASYIEATPATRLFEMYFEQDLFNKAVSIRIGQLSADSQFILSEGGGAFINGTWGWPSISASNLPNGGPAFPLATPGVSVTLAPSDKVTILAGLYNGDPVGPCTLDDPQRCNNDGLEFRLEGPPLAMYEGAYKYEFGALPGTIKVGGWTHFGNFNHLRFDSDGIPTTVSGNDARVIDNNYGFYGIIDQLIWKVPGSEDAKGIAIFGRLIGSPSDRNEVDFYAEAGFTFSGMIPARPDDILGIGFAYTGISSNAASADKDQALGVVRSYESLIEICYTAQIVPGWTIQPDFQYIWNPGGRVGADETATEPVGDVTIVGLRTTLDY